MINLCDIRLLHQLLSGCATKFDNWWLDTIFDWQTLITGIAAGLPAMIGAWLLWRQINDQRSETARARQQLETAARIRMPHALSELSEYWKHCFRAIVENDLTLKTNEIPLGALEIIMAAAPTVDVKTFKSLRTLVISSQIFESRIRSAKITSNNSITSTLLVDVAQLDYITTSLYDFARFEVDAIDVPAPDRVALSKQVYNGLDLHTRLCAVEARKMKVESALNKHFKESQPRQSLLH